MLESDHYGETEAIFSGFAKDALSGIKRGIK